jgi:hypothetical protein
VVVVIVMAAIAATMLIGGRMVTERDRSKRRVLREQLGQPVTLVVEKGTDVLKTWALDERDVVIEAVQGSAVSVAEQSAVKASPLSRIREVRSTDQTVLARW